jgi:hypothetical protein
MERQKELECNLPLARDCARMGLLSLFKCRSGDATPTPPEMEDTATGETRSEPNLLWRCGTFDSYSLGEHVQAIHRDGEPPIVLPAFAVEFASGCSEWKSLSDHVAYQVERHGWDSLQVETLKRILPELTTGGVLISSAIVLERLAAMSPGPASSPPQIAALGFPTGGDRVALLERSIRSFARNLSEHGRKAEFLVADSSGNTRHTDAFRTCLIQLGAELDIPISFSARPEKEAFARALVEIGACSYETAEFALLDPLETGFACGANRNALLLHCAGQMLCSIDDDVVCDLFRSGPAEQRLALFSNRDPFSRWLFPDKESAETFAVPESADFLAAHESLLGKSARDLVRGLRADECDFGNLRDRVLERLSAPNLRIRSTFFGHLGDPGIPSSAYYLYYDGENRRRLTESEERYQAVFSSRSVQTLCPVPAIGDASVSPGMAMGLDHRELLPPFFPVLHAEDFSWGAAVWQCCGRALLGHVPLAIRHAPPPKPILTPADFTADRRVVIFEWAHLLRYLLLEFEPAARLSDSERMIGLGKHLSALAALAPADFVYAIGKLILRFESERLSWLERELREDHETPDYWREDLERHIDHVRASLAHDDFDIPLDLKSKGSPEDNRLFMQRALGRYGRLLQEWPVLVQGAITLRGSGRALFVKLPAGNSMG